MVISWRAINAKISGTPSSTNSTDQILIGPWQFHDFCGQKLIAIDDIVHNVTTNVTHSRSYCSHAHFVKCNVTCDHCTISIGQRDSLARSVMRSYIVLNLYVYPDVYAVIYCHYDDNLFITDDV